MCIRDRTWGLSALSPAAACSTFQPGAGEKFSLGGRDLIWRKARGRGGFAPIGVHHPTAFFEKDIGHAAQICPVVQAHAR